MRSNYKVGDVYEWWWSRRHEWPQLTRMALDVLTAPPMSDAPERVLSQTGLMVTDRRNNLSEHTIDVASCLQSWTKEEVIQWTTGHVEAATTTSRERFFEGDKTDTTVAVEAPIHTLFDIAASYGD